MRSAKFRKIIIQNTRLYPRAVFRDLCIYSKSHMCTGSAAQIFNFFQISSLPPCHVFPQVSDNSNSKWPTSSHFYVKMEQILSVRPDISQTIEHFVLKHYTSICYLCAMRSAKFRKIIIQNTRLRALFTKLWNFSKSHMCTGSAAQIFNCFQICLVPLFLLFGQTLILWGILLPKRYTCFTYLKDFLPNIYTFCEVEAYYIIILYFITF